MRNAQPITQIEMAELMCEAGNFSVGYARCLMAVTPAEQLVDGDRRKDARGLTPEDVSRVEHELESLGRKFKLIEESHGKGGEQKKASAE